jgi:hypothetical protein
MPTRNKIELSHSDIEARKIPITSLRHFYQLLSKFSKLQFHVEFAREACRADNPAKLAEMMRDSVKQFERYRNTTDPFKVDDRQILPNPEAITEIATTNDMVAFLQDPHHTTVRCEGWEYEYVDREVTPARTRWSAFYVDGTKAPIRELHCDILLRNKKDNTPIIGEIKVKNDKNPFFGLIQSMMYAAELVTEPQRLRLTQSYPSHFSSEHILKKVDLWLLLYDYNKRSKHRQEVLKHVNKLCGLLCSNKAFSDYVRRIGCCEGHLSGSGSERHLELNPMFTHPS